MKKRLPLILFICCLCVIAIGVVGLSRSCGAERPQSPANDAPSRTKGIAESPAATTGTDVDLLAVKSPTSLKTDLKNYEGFRVSFNKDNHTPNWVAWELLGTETEGMVPRHNKFWQDLDLEGCPQTSDYSRSGYDRGHLCPAADQKWSETAMTDCFSMANIAPQAHELNTGAWKTLENKERLWAQRDSAIVIVAGPIYTDADTQRIGETGVRVPGAFFKVLAAPYLPEPRGIAFVYPNMTAPGNMENYVMTIRDVEKLTGLDFFHLLPDDIEEAMETSASFRDWNRRAKNDTSR